MKKEEKLFPHLFGRSAFAATRRCCPEEGFPDGFTENAAGPKSRRAFFYRTGTGLSFAVCSTGRTSVTVSPHSLKTSRRAAKSRSVAFHQQVGRAVGDRVRDAEGLPRA